LLSSIRFNPTVEKLQQLIWWAKPDICGGFAPLLADEHAEVRPLGAVNGAQGVFVGDVVAEEGNGIACARIVERGFFEDGLDCVSLVAAGAEFETGFEFEQLQPIQFCKGFEESASLLLDVLCLFRRGGAPVHDCAIGLVFEESAKAVVVELLAQLVEPGAGLRRKLLELAATVWIEPLTTVQAPDFERLFEANQRRNFGCRPAANHDDAGASLLLNPLDPFPHAGPWEGAEAIEAKWGEGAIVVQEQ